MKQSAENIKKRRDVIFNMLIKEGQIQVSEISELLNVSELTIRRDLEFFEEKKIVERFYGGARLISDTIAYETDHRLELIKQEIAKKASEYINDGDVIFLNTSSTALYLLQFVDNKEITVITNNLRASNQILNSSISLILTGGELRRPKYALVGDFALGMLDSVVANKLVMGCSGLSIEDGISTSTHSEVAINKKMIERTDGSRLLLVDHTKFLHTARFSVNEVDSVTTIITDDLVSQDIIKELEKFKNLEIIQVDTTHLDFIES